MDSLNSGGAASVIGGSVVGAVHRRLRRDRMSRVPPIMLDTLMSPVTARPGQTGWRARDIAPNNKMVSTLKEIRTVRRYYRDGGEDADAQEIAEERVADKHCE